MTLNGKNFRVIVGDYCPVRETPDLVMAPLTYGLRIAEAILS